VVFFEVQESFVHMFDNAFTDGASLIHRFDPRFKIIAAAAFSIVIAVCSRWTALIPGLFVSTALIVIGRLPIKKVCIRLMVVNGFILFLWFFLPFSFKGMPLLTVGPFTATKEGILYVTLLTLRSNIILLALISLVATSSVFTLSRAMRELRVPDKIVQLFFFTYRYLHVIQLEYERMVNTLKIRGFQPKTNMHTYKTYAYLVGMLLVKSYDRAERIRKAMLCRGFKGSFYNLSEFCVKRSDIVMMCLMLMAVAVISLLQWTKTIY
jgi:cobalt/nickel transport system permease protein